jgi:hypothetical protein
VPQSVRETEVRPLVPWRALGTGAGVLGGESLGGLLHPMAQALGKRAADNIRVELGEVRNKGMQGAIRARQPGGMFREVEPDYSREIRMPDVPSPSTEIWIAAIRLATLALGVPGLEPLIGTPDGTGEPCT